MPRNQIQFQKGMSLGTFQRHYGTEEQCHEALMRMRWPDGFVCPRCSGRHHSFCKPKRVFQCSACRLQTSVKAGTIFHKSQTPLTKWFCTMHFMTTAKNDVAALELMRHLDVTWKCANLIKQKLMEVMFQRNSMYKLEGDIQIDDAYQGGEKSGKTGRGAGNKAPFIVAVQTRSGRPVFAHIRCVTGFTKKAIRAYAERAIKAGSRVLSDGLKCWKGFAEAGLEHMVKVTGGGRPRDSEFKWVNTLLGNVQSAIIGTCRSCNSQHLPRYLAAYEWRFNRRFELDKNIERLARAALTTKPTPYRKIIAI
ncbi:MAG: IS1595 family transposase [Pseudomonadota bacterium]